jgi:hypothetical protein
MAVRVIMRRYGPEIGEGQYEAVLDAISAAGLRLMISSANSAYFAALGVDPSELKTADGPTVAGARRYLEGDLVPASDWSEVAYVGLYREVSGEPPPRMPTRAAGVETSKYYLEAGAVTRSGESGVLRAICEAASRVLRSESGGGNGWSPLAWSNKKFDDLLAQGAFQQAAFSQGQTSASTLLLSKDLWKLTAAVKASGGMLIKTFQQMGGTDTQVAELESAGLLRKEHVLICRATSALLNRFPAKDVLGVLDNQGVRCASCGRPLSEERADEMLVQTDLARDLLDHSRWMAILFVEAVKKLGVPEGRILLEFQDGGEEVDAFVDVDGDLLMAELKDKEFSMGHAYPLSGRIAMYHPDHVLIVARDGVAPEVKNYFARIKPEARLAYVEDLGQLDAELESAANAIRSAKALTLLEYFDPLTLGSGIARLVVSKLGLPVEKRRRRRTFESRYFSASYADLFAPEWVK